MHPIRNRCCCCTLCCFSELHQWTNSVSTSARIVLKTALPVHPSYTKSPPEGRLSARGRQRSARQNMELSRRWAFSRSQWPRRKWTDYSRRDRVTAGISVSSSAPIEKRSSLNVENFLRSYVNAVPLSVFPISSKSCSKSLVLVMFGRQRFFINPVGNEW